MKYGNDRFLARRYATAHAVVQAADSSIIKRLKKLPGLSPIPIIGDMLTMRFQRGRYFETMANYRKAGQIWSTRTPDSQTVYVHNSETIAQILESEHELVSTARQSRLPGQSRTGSLLSTEMPEHAVFRQAFFKVLSNTALQEYLPATYDAVRRNLQSAAQSGQPLTRQYKEMVALLLAMLTSRYEPEIAAKVGDLYLEMFTMLQTGQQMFASRFTEMPAKVAALVRPPVEAAIQECFGGEDAASLNGTAREPELSSSMVCNMRRACLQAGFKDLEGIWPEFAMSQLNAGSFTMPVVSLHLISAFGRYTAAAQKAREDQARVVEKFGDELTWRALEDWEYGERFVKEVLRTGHQVTYVPRGAKTDLNVDGYFVPKGSTILMRATSAPVIPEFEDTAHVFNPDRWVDHPNPSTFQPFGTGPRSCVARAAGLLQLKLILWELARSYQVEGTHVDQSFEDVPVNEDQVKLVQLEVLATARV